jgi:hypothetical protein
MMNESAENPMDCYLGHPELIDEDEELDAWAFRFCKFAESEGYTVEFDELRNDEQTVEATVRVVYSQRGLAGIHLEQWQRNPPPSARECGYLLRFSEPHEWSGAEIFVPDPSSMDYARLFMAVDEQTIAFEIHKRSRIGWTNAAYRQVVRSIAADMEDDYCASSNEFVVIAQRAHRSIYVELSQGHVAADVELVPDENGIAWSNTRRK